LDAINFCGEAWDAVSQSMIVNCWKKTKILPDYNLNTIHELQEELNNDEIIREEIDELQEEINKLYFSEPISAMEFVNIDNGVSEEFSDAEIIETVRPSQNNEVAEDEGEGIEPEPSIPVKSALEYSENILSFLKNPPPNFSYNLNTLSTFQKFHSQLFKFHLDSLKQSTMDDFFTNE